MNAIERAMQIREKPNDAVSRRFRSGLLFVGNVTV